ncbi:hypothetical protein ACIPJS_39190 [Streptomyces sp. NPDC086783]|uniref:hypothetical protein n=1 Tax=Streptomyces sp. NPDC086783 TaxID=3365758 RepID=UPI003818748A
MNASSIHEKRLRSEMRKVRNNAMRAVIAALSVSSLALTAAAYAPSASAATLPIYDSILKPWNHDSEDALSVGVSSSGNKSYVEYVLNTPKDITWHKWITIYDKRGNEISQASTVDSQHSSKVLFLPASQVNNGAYMVFSKAKFLGAKADMFEIPLSNFQAHGQTFNNATPGAFYSIWWNEDDLA